MSQTPHNVDAEQQLLGMILCNNETFDLVSDILTKDHFFDPVHAKIFTICSDRITKGHRVDPVSLRTVLEGDEGLKQLGGPAYLARMAGAAISHHAARDYAGILIEQAIRRSLAVLAAEASQGISGGRDSLEVRGALLAGLSALPEGVGEESSVSLLKATMRAVERANEAYQGRQTFLRTGVGALDAILKGLGPGDLMLLGGTTSMGKTALALEIASNVARAGNPVAFWSLEMEEEQLAARMASARSRVPYSALRDAESMDEKDFRKWVEACREHESVPLHIIPKRIRDIPAGYAAARRIKAKAGGLGLIVVDYAQLVRGSGKGRYEQMTEVSIGLKTMGGMMGCPVIALVQLDRKIGDRDDKRPNLNDIKETGQFENDADQAVFCHREEYWLERQGPKPDRDGKVSDGARADWEVELKAARNVMEIIVRKNRHGRVATAQVGFHAPTNRFWALGEGAGEWSDQSF